MRGSVHILVPKLIAKIGFDEIDKMCRERNCQARGSSGEHSEVVDRIDVHNRAAARGSILCALNLKIATAHGGCMAPAYFLCGGQI